MFGLFKAPPEVDPLDKVLFRWTKEDPVTRRDLLRSTAIFGATGSGKSSGSGKWLAEALLNDRSIGGIILADKPESKPTWQTWFRNADRKQDLFIYEPGGKLKVNYLDFVRQMGGDARDICRFIKTSGDVLNAGTGNEGGHSGKFFEVAEDRLLYHAVVMVKLGTGHVTIPYLQEFITTALRSPAEAASPAWTGCVHDVCTHKASDAVKTPAEAHDFRLALDYFFKEFLRMEEKTRSSIETGVQGKLHLMNSGVVREMVSDETNFSLDSLKTGRWLLVNMPPASFGDSGRVVYAGIKFLVQQMILRRDASGGGGVVVIWCDEAQEVVNKEDAVFLAQCRSHLGCMVYLTQSLASYYGAMKGETGKQHVDSLIGNFGTKIFHAIGDVQTAEWASNLVGKERQTFTGGSMAPGADSYDQLVGQQTFTGTFSQQVDYIVQPNVFMNNLRTGGKGKNHFVVDAIVVKNGELFADGRSFKHVSFSQR